MADIKVIYDQDYADYQSGRSWFRKAVRQLYLNNILKYVKGKTIDFGCGIGELLARLPQGSIGLEVNEHAVRYCKDKKGLDVRLYHPETDNYRFEQYNHGQYSTFVMAHVLEHLEMPHDIIRTILGSCNRLGITRIILVVPGLKGFRYDSTHKTFVDSLYLAEHGLIFAEGYAITHEEYFPLNFQLAGNFFTHNELMVIYDKSNL